MPIQKWELSVLEFITEQRIFMSNRPVKAQLKKHIGKITNEQNNFEKSRNDEPLPTQNFNFSIQIQSITIHRDGKED